MKKLALAVFLCSAFLLMGTTAWAIPDLGIAPGNVEGDYANLSFDGFPLAIEADDTYQLTAWAGSNSGNWDPSHLNIWLLTDSASGGTFQWNGVGFGSDDDNQFSVASYKEDVYGINLGSPDGWASLSNNDPSTFYSYEFGDGNKDFRYLTGTLTAPGIEIGDWMYVVAVSTNPGEIEGFSPKTTSSMATPEPATLLLLGSGLVGLAGIGRKKFKK